MLATCMIELSNVNITVGGGAFRVRDVNMNIDGKAILLGPNGSGKTTLLRAICGLIPYEGSIRINGLEVDELRGYMPLSCNLPEIYQMAITLSGLLEIFEDLKGVDVNEFRNILSRFNISYDSIAKKPIFALSAGQSAIVRLALTLSSRPKVIIIDEPFENVDPARRSVISSLLLEYGEEGLIVTHELDTLMTFRDMDAYLMIEGRAYGPMKVGKLLNSGIVEGEVKGALTVRINGKPYSIVEGQGIRFLEMGSLNRLYGLIG